MSPPDPELPARASYPHLALIGLVGGIGSGKSHVARQFEAHGARIIDADRLAHEVLASPPLRSAVEALFAPVRVVSPDGRVDRAAIAARVFEERRATGDERPPLLRRLEELVHPAVRAAILVRLAAWNAEGGRHVVVLDVPLLVERGWDALCDRIVFVEATDAERLRRVRETRGWDEAAWRAREAAQAPLEVKRRLATTVIPNHDDGASGEGGSAAASPLAARVVHELLSTPERTSSTEPRSEDP